MLHRSGHPDKGQSGFALLELVVAAAIAGFIGIGTTAAVFQVINVNTLSTNHVLAVKQVENAIHWISRDAQMAQVVQTAGESGFPLTLSWVEWDNTRQRVSYVLEDGQLRRTYSLNDGEPTWTDVAWHIDAGADETSCEYTGGVLTLKMTATPNGANESRVVQVIPRPAP